MSVTTGGAATGMPACRKCGSGRNSSSGSEPLHGQQRSCGLCGLACRAAVRGARLQDADRPADLQPLAGPRLRPDGHRPGVRRSGPVPLTYYCPYSGQTRPGGVTGRLVDLGLYPLASGYTEAFWAPGPGGIALVRTAASVLAGSGSDGNRRLRAAPDLVQAAADYMAYAAALANPAWQGIFEPVPLLDAKDAGVLGVVVARASAKVGRSSASGRAPSAAIRPVSWLRLVTTTTQPGDPGSSGRTCSASRALSNTTSTRRPAGYGTRPPGRPG